MLDPRLLRAFVTIAETGSFTQAADRLHITQSTISQQLGRLERAAGRELIDRAARPARPTAAGERLLGYARRLLALQGEAETLLFDSSGVSPIRIGLPEDIANRPMADAFARFAHGRREIRLDVTTALSRDLTASYRGGELDIVVVKEALPAADCRAAFPEPLSWFESEAGPAEVADPIPLVVFPPGGLYREAMFERIERERRQWYVAFSGSSLQSILAAVEAGLGLSLLPIGTVGGWRVRPHAGFGPEPDIAVSVYAWESSGVVGELVETIIAVLADRVREQAGA